MHKIWKFKKSFLKDIVDAFPEPRPAYTAISTVIELAGMPSRSKMEKFETVYAHLDSYCLETGKKVVKGELIVEVGNTGQSTGPHLHFEVRKNGQHGNPSDYY